jgi:hypothetical protein
LLRGLTLGRCQLALERKCSTEIAPQAIEGRLPTRYRVGFAALRDITHQSAELCEVVLNTEELQRVLAVAFADRGLLIAETADLRKRIDAHGTYGREREA